MQLAIVPLRVPLANGGSDNDLRCFLIKLQMKCIRIEVQGAMSMSSLKNCFSFLQQKGKAPYSTMSSLKETLFLLCLRAIHFDIEHSLLAIVTCSSRLDVKSKEKPVKSKEEERETNLWEPWLRLEGCDLLRRRLWLLSLASAPLMLLEESDDDDDDDDDAEEDDVASDDVHEDEQASPPLLLLLLLLQVEARSLTMARLIVSSSVSWLFIVIHWKQDFTIHC